MNKWNAMLLSLWLWMASSSKAADVSVMEVIKVSFQTGQAHDLATHFDKQIELMIDTETIDFSSVRADHAEVILKTFFRKYPPRRFQYVYQGNTSRMRYSTGVYQAGGASFSVYVLMRYDPRRQFVINTLHLRKA